MRKLMILCLCALFILSGCSSSQLKEEQQKIYHGFKDALLDNGDLISGNIPFSYDIEVEEKDGKYVYTVIVHDTKVAMSNIQMMILNPADANKDIDTATIGIFDEIKYNMIPNQENEKDGYYKKIQLQGSSEEKDFKVYATLSWKDSNQLIQYQVFFSFNVMNGKA